MQSTEEFVQRLDAIRIDPGDILVRIDVKHFYMSGTHDELVSAILKAFPRTLLRQRLKEAVYFLLAHQYIESKLLPGRCWVTKIGSGMGLRHSGAIADLAFAMLAELPWALKPYNLSAYGIKTYMRFKDDIFVVANDKINCVSGTGVYVTERHASRQLSSNIVFLVFLCCKSLLVSKIVVWLPDRNLRK